MRIMEKNTLYSPIWFSFDKLLSGNTLHAMLRTFMQKKRKEGRAIKVKLPPHPPRSESVCDLYTYMLLTTIQTMLAGFSFLSSKNSVKKKKKEQISLKNKKGTPTRVVLYVTQTVCY